MKRLGLKKRKFEDVYELGPEIASGAFAIVYEATLRKTGERFAAKVIDKRDLGQAELKTLRGEIDIMRKCEHRNLLKLLDSFESDREIVFVTDLIEGGDLFSRIKQPDGKLRRLDERETAQIVAQIISGVDYLHSKNIAHRDLKPDNVLLGANGQVKIADFGLSKMFDGGEQLKTTVGTLDYMAPEVVLSDVYDKAVDYWSIGVMTYVLLSGRLPFFSKKPALLFQKISNCEYDMDGAEWETISDDAKDFVTRLIRKNPSERMQAEVCLKHPFISNDPKAYAMLDLTLPVSTERRSRLLLRQKQARDSKRSSLRLIAEEEPASPLAASSPTVSNSFGASGGGGSPLGRTSSMTAHAPSTSSLATTSSTASLDVERGRSSSETLPVPSAASSSSSLHRKRESASAGASPSGSLENVASPLAASNTSSSSSSGSALRIRSRDKRTSGGSSGGGGGGGGSGGGGGGHRKTSGAASLDSGTSPLSRASRSSTNASNSGQLGLSLPESDEGKFSL